MTHLSEEHVGSGKGRYTCEWEGCERSTTVCCNGGVEGGSEEEDDDEEEWEKKREEREDKGVFRQRQKVVRHLQMHTGEHCLSYLSLCISLFFARAKLTRRPPYPSFSCCSRLSPTALRPALCAGDRPHTCSVCGKSFSEGLTLTQVRLSGYSSLAFSRLSSSFFPRW